MNNRMRQMACRSSQLFQDVPRKKTYSDEWYTPEHIVKALGPFDLDPCAGAMNHGKVNYRENGLGQPWEGRVWMNPPYSDIQLWLEKFAEHDNGIALVNARPETKWFQWFCGYASAVLFIYGRLDFYSPGSKPGRPPCGSVLVAYGPGGNPEYPGNADYLKASGIPGLFVPEMKLIRTEPIYKYQGYQTSAEWAEGREI